MRLGEIVSYFCMQKIYAFTNIFMLKPGMLITLTGVICIQGCPALGSSVVSNVLFDIQRPLQRRVQRPLQRPDLSSAVSGVLSSVLWASNVLCKCQHTLQRPL